MIIRNLMADNLKIFFPGYHVYNNINFTAAIFLEERGKTKSLLHSFLTHFNIAWFITASHFMVLYWLLSLHGRDNIADQTINKIWLHK